MNINGKNYEIPSVEGAKIRVRLHFTDPILGSWPSNPDIATDYIASKAPDAMKIEQEIENLGVESVCEKGMTIFPRREEDNAPIFYDYQVRGFFKESCALLSKASGKDATGKKKESNHSSKIKAYKKTVDGSVFVYPREIAIETDGMIEDCQRPLRASTPMGERVALAHSEMIPAENTWCEFTVEVLSDDLIPAVLEWLAYGRMHGMSQWRNSGKGRFMFEVLDDDGNVIGGNYHE